MAEKKVATYELIARSDGWTYSMKLQREKIWRHVTERPAPEYIPFESYQPLHLKNLRRGLKLFLEARWPGYARNPKHPNFPKYFTNPKKV